MKVALLGDIGLFGDYSLSENKDLTVSLKYMSDFLSQFDVVVGNLETPFNLSSKPYGSKSAYISSNPINIDLLKFLNITHVNLSNNHVYDYGSDSYDLTKKILESAGIEYFGVENKQAFVSKGEVKIALNGFCNYDTNPMNVTFSDRKGVNGLDVNYVTEIFKKNDANGYFNVFSFHSGQEHVNFPSYNDIIFARKLSEIAPYVYYGHHPHVIQPYELVNSSLINYSLGNFCFSDVYNDKSNKPLVKMSSNNRCGLISTFELDCDGVKNSNQIPIFISSDELILNDDRAMKVLNDSQKIFDVLVSLRDDYSDMRNSLLNDYLLKRKKLRDLRWIINRLSLRYVKLFLNSKKNNRKYKKHFLNKLS